MESPLRIRVALPSDLSQIAAVEAECFPAAEAATADEFADRVRSYGSHFYLMLDGDRIVSFVNGLCTDEKDLRDEMYADASLHKENGAWQMIFGVDTVPQYRKQGLAGQLLQRMIEDARTQGRKGLVLTCKDHLVHYYASFGFVNEGVSGSAHGNAVWNQMRLTF